MHELYAFAERYIGPFDHFSQIDAEHLAKAVRRAFNLPLLPSPPDLECLIAHLGIGIARERFRATVSFPGANDWPSDGRPMIHLRDGVEGPFASMTFGHELREILENAFRRVKPTYVGLDTWDNAAMHRESERFAAALLMPASTMRSLLLRTGFDAARIAHDTGRSLSSVILRIEEVAARSANADAVNIGFWLYEAPWVEAGDRAIVATDVAMKVCAGIGECTRWFRRSGLAPAFVPTRGSRAIDHWLVAEAVQHGAVAVAEPDAWIGHPRDFILIAEPLSMAMPSRKVLLTAIDREAVDYAGPWLLRFEDELLRAGVEIPAEDFRRRGFRPRPAIRRPSALRVF